MNLSVARQKPVPEGDRLAPSPSTRSGSWLSLLMIFLLWAVIYLAGMFTPALLDDVDMARGGEFCHCARTV